MAKEIPASSPDRQIVRKFIDGREIVICDHFAPAADIVHIAGLLSTLSYRRSETSRPGTEVSGSVAEIPEVMASVGSFFDHMRAFGEEMFPGERFTRQRLYVNNSVYGDMYYPHRDCAPHLRNITLLYYANLTWQRDWGGETIFYNDNHDAELAVSPRPGRLVASRGAILHRGGVPSRICFHERLSIAYKLAAIT